MTAVPIASSIFGQAGLGVRAQGHLTLAVCNVVGSTIAREADGGVYLHAGPEVGVASTKAFTSQVTVLTMLALYLGRTRHLSSVQGARMIEELRAVPDAIRQTLEQTAASSGQAIQSGGRGPIQIDQFRDAVELSLQARQARLGGVENATNGSGWRSRLAAGLRRQGAGEARAGC